MIAIIDYDAGNTKSVVNSLSKLGVESIITSDYDEIKNSSGIILPGVGAFAAAMKSLAEKNLDVCIKDNVYVGKPFLGICLGMQLLFETSYEDEKCNGLGLIPGSVQHFSENPDFDSELKIPHMGWNKLIAEREDRIGKNLGENEYAYFVHSYYAVPENWDDVIYYADYSIKVPAVVKKDNVIGMQFHPEKSGDAGMQLLKNFLEGLKS